MHNLFTILSLLSSALAAPLQPRQGSGSVTGNGLSFYNPNLSAGAGLKSPTTYTCYAGGPSGFPKQAQWASFNSLWKFQSGNALAPIGDSQAQIQDMHDAIVAVSKAAKVDARVILAVIIQESTGKVDVGCVSRLPFLTVALTATD